MADLADRSGVWGWAEERRMHEPERHSYAIVAPPLSGVEFSVFGKEIADRRKRPAIEARLHLWKAHPRGMPNK